LRKAGDGAVSTIATGPSPFAIQPFNNAEPMRPAPARRSFGGAPTFVFLRRFGIERTLQLLKE
jgi:hypothetical protein